MDGFTWGGGSRMDGFTWGGGSRMDVENSLESHNPVEIGDLRAPEDSGGKSDPMRKGR